MSGFSLPVLCLMLFTESLIYSVDSLQCKDENNEDIDWFVIYKIPKMNYIEELKPYIVAKSTDPHTPLTVKPDNVENSKMKGSKMLAHTLLPLSKSVFKKQQKGDEPIASVMYKSASGTGNGVLMATKNSGFWLLHTIPLLIDSLPNSEGELFTFPDNNRGHLLMCISVDSDSVTSIAFQLSYMEVERVYQDLPEALKENYRALYNVKQCQYPGIYGVSRETIKHNNYNSEHEIISYAANRNYQEDLYTFISLDIKKYLAVRWPYNVVHPDKGFKGPVTNIGEIMLGVGSAEDCHVIKSIPEFDDSIWVVSESDITEVHWFCIGTAGRSVLNPPLGAGAVCFRSPYLWAIFFRFYPLRY